MKILLICINGYLYYIEFTLLRYLPDVAGLREPDADRRPAHLCRQVCPGLARHVPRL